MREPRRYDALRETHQEVNDRQQPPNGAEVANPEESPSRPSPDQARYERGPGGGGMQEQQEYATAEAKRRHELAQAQARTSQQAEPASSTQTVSAGEAYDKALADDEAALQRFQDRRQSGRYRERENLHIETSRQNQEVVEQNAAAQRAETQNRLRQRGDREQRDDSRGRGEQQQADREREQEITYDER